MTWLERNEIIVDKGEELTNSEENSNIPNISEEEIIRKFLKENNLSDFIEKFESEKLLSYDLLPKLTDADLEKIGIQTIGERKKS